MNTLRAALFLPTSREMKYKSKQAIDTFFVRAGDVLSAGLVFALSQVLQLGIRVFAGLNVGFILIWLILARQISRAAPTPVQAERASREVSIPQDRIVVRSSTLPTEN